MSYTQHKPFKVGGIMRIGEVEVHVDLLQSDQIKPGSRIPLNVEIANSSEKGEFDEIRIRLNEVHSWTSIIGPKRGTDSSIMTEVTKLTKKNIRSWTEQIDYRHRRVILLDNMSLDVPTIAICDRNSGLVRIHHVLEVKLISHGYSVDNMRFRFPLVIGGKQYDEASPKRHAVSYLNDIHAEQVLTDTIAAVVTGITRSAEHLLGDPEQHHTLEHMPEHNTRPILSRQEKLIRSASLSHPEQSASHPATTRPALLRQHQQLFRAISI
jgi:hypothetical protein